MSGVPNRNEKINPNGSTPLDSIMNQYAEPTHGPSSLHDRTDRLIIALLQFAKAFQNPVQAAIAPTSAASAPDQTLDRFLRFQPPKIQGEPDDRNAEECLEESENIFKVLGYLDDHKIVLATFRFEGVVRAWWRSRELSWEQNHTKKTWINFLEDFNNKYVPTLVREQREEEFTVLRQGVSSVATYEACLSRLVKYSPHLLMNRGALKSLSVDFDVRFNKH